MRPRIITEHNDPRALACEKVLAHLRSHGIYMQTAQRLGIKHPALNQWKVVPAERVLDIEAITGISRYAIRPDLYGSIFDVYPGLAALCASFGVTVEEFIGWRKVPARKVEAIEIATGIPRDVIAGWRSSAEAAA